MARVPRGAQARHRRTPRSRQRGLDGGEQHTLLHPAAREGVERQHLAHERAVGQVQPPALDVG
ncbi:MAG: hypothetical protein MUC32_10265, partial [Burkholderiaceae bacterium]|nr:hypothetical protein [Burkholderiaceae bacterium]